MKKSDKAPFAILIILYLAVFVLSFSIGRFPVGPAELLKILLSRILPIAQDWTTQAESVVFNIRLPRILASSLIGAASGEKQNRKQKQDTGPKPASM